MGWNDQGMSIGLSSANSDRSPQTNDLATDFARNVVDPLPLDSSAGDMHAFDRNTGNTDNDGTNINTNHNCSLKQIQQNPLYYQLLYMTICFIWGVLGSMTVLILPYIENKLNIKPSQASSLYSICYFCSLLGALLTNKIIDDNYSIINIDTHLFASILTIFGCIALVLITYANSYSIMVLFWFIVGIWMGCLWVVSMSFTFRIYSSNGAKIWTRMILILMLTALLISFIYKSDRIKLIVFLVVGVSVICCFIMIFILPEPKEVHAGIIIDLKSQTSKTSQSTQSPQSPQSQPVPTPRAQSPSLASVKSKSISDVDIDSTRNSDFNFDFMETS